jgi:hypothetical protein
MIYLELLQEYKSHCTNSIELEGLIELDLHTAPVFPTYTPIYAWQSPEAIAMFRGE